MQRPTLLLVILCTIIVQLQAIPKCSAKQVQCIISGGSQTNSQGHAVPKFWGCIAFKGETWNNQGNKAKPCPPGMAKRGQDEYMEGNTVNNNGPSGTHYEVKEIHDLTEMWICVEPGKQSRGSCNGNNLWGTVQARANMPNKNNAMTGFYNMYQDEEYMEDEQDRQSGAGYVGDAGYYYQSQPAQRYLYGGGYGTEWSQFSMVGVLSMAVVLICLMGFVCLCCGAGTGYFCYLFAMQQNKANKQVNHYNDQEV